MGSKIPVGNYSFLGALVGCHCILFWRRFTNVALPGEAWNCTTNSGYDNVWNQSAVATRGFPGSLTRHLTVDEVHFPSHDTGLQSSGAVKLHSASYVASVTAEEERRSPQQPRPARPHRSYYRRYLHCTTYSPALLLSCSPVQGSAGAGWHLISTRKELF